MPKKYLLSLLLFIVALSLMAARAQQPTPPNDDALIKEYQKQINNMPANVATAQSLSTTWNAKSSYFSTEATCDSPEL